MKNLLVSSLCDTMGIGSLFVTLSVTLCTLEYREEFSPFERVCQSHTLRYQWLVVNGDSDTMGGSIIESANT